MKDRDYISEIHDFKSRSKDKSWDQLKFDLETLECGLDCDRLFQIETLNNEFFKYIPIRLVACIETFFRLVAKSLIDSDKDYKINCKAFNSKNIKIDFNSILAIEAQNVSVGDIISHLLSFKNLDDINSNISTILAKDLLHELKDHYSPSQNEYVKHLNEKWHSSYDDVLRVVKDVFNTRHILCHEFGAKIDIQRDDAIEYLENCKTFIYNADSYFNSVLYDDAFIHSGEEWSGYMDDMYAKANEELDDVIEIYKNNIVDKQYDFSKFDLAIEKWKEFRDLFTEFNVSPYEQANEIYGTFLNADKIGITHGFVKDLIVNFERKNINGS